MRQPVWVVLTVRPSLIFTGNFLLENGNTRLDNVRPPFFDAILRHAEILGGWEKVHRVGKGKKR